MRQTQRVRIYFRDGTPFRTITGGVYVGDGVVSIESPTVENPIHGQEDGAISNIVYPMDIVHHVVIENLPPISPEE